MIRQERSAGFVVFYQSAPGIAKTSSDTIDLLVSPPTETHGGETPTKTPPEREFLLLDYGRHWDFPKGHVEAGENDLQTAVRELHEETAIADPCVIPGFQREMTYFFRHKRHGLIRKTVVFFLAQTPTRDVTLSHEHSGFVFARYEDALKRLTFSTARQMLRAAGEWLGENS